MGIVPARATISAVEHRTDGNLPAAVAFHPVSRTRKRCPQNRARPRFSLGALSCGFRASAPTLASSGRKTVAIGDEHDHYLPDGVVRMVVPTPESILFQFLAGVASTVGILRIIWPEASRLVRHIWRDITAAA